MMDLLYTLALAVLLFTLFWNAAGPVWGIAVIVVAVLWWLRRHLKDAVTAGSRRLKAQHARGEGVARPAASPWVTTDPHPGRPLELPPPATEEDALAQQIIQLRRRLAYLRRPGIGEFVLSLDEVALHEFAIRYEDQLLPLAELELTVGPMRGASGYRPDGASVDANFTDLHLTTPSERITARIDTSFIAYVNVPGRGWTNGYEVGAVDRHRQAKQSAYTDMTESRRVGYMERKENWRWQRRISDAELDAFVRVARERAAAARRFTANRPAEFAEVRARLADAKARLQALVGEA